MAEKCVNRDSMANDKQLNIWLNNEEPTWGKITSLKVVGSKNLACFKPPKPAVKSLVARRMIGASRPPTPDGASHIGDGEALIQNVPVKFSLFRLG